MNHNYAKFRLKAWNHSVPNMIIEYYYIKMKIIKINL